MNQHPRSPDLSELAAIEDDMRAAGLTPRGAFHPVEKDGVPPVAQDAAGKVPTRTVMLAGNVGPGMWRAYQEACGAGSIGLDEWSEKTLGVVAARWQGRAVFPFGKPYLPFQRWATRAESCEVSPVAILVHPEYGLWHAYRGALLFERDIALPEREHRPSPCLGCVARPCLTACPAGAFSSTYDVAACARHVRASPESGCAAAGCLVRHACPVGRGYRYEPEQARFHMRAFIVAHGG
jgi:hypothetical protein